MSLPIKLSADAVQVDSVDDFDLTRADMHKYYSTNSPQPTVGDFKNLGYVVIRNLIDVNEALKLYEYTLKNVNAGNMKDDQVPGSPSFYQDQKMSVFHKTFLHKIEEVVQLKLIPTFCYYRTYRSGAERC